MPRISTDNYDTVASWNGSQDLFVVEQPDGTKVATPAMVKQYVLGNSIDDIYSVMGQMGAKNLLVPEWTETKTTENGVTYTFNADGTIIMNTDESGATADTNCNLRNKDVTTNNLFPAGSYIFTGCPEGGSATKYRTWLRAYRPNTSIALTTNLYEEGNGVTFTIAEPFTLGINATVKSGYVCNNLTWKPMLRYASDTDNTYQPYAMTNKQLTEVIGDLSQTGLAGDSVAGQLGTAKNQIATKIEGLVYARTDHTSLTARMDSITAQRKSGVYIMYCSSVNPDFSTIGYCMAIGFTIYGSVSAIVAVNTQTGEIWTNGNTSQNAGDWRGWRKIN